MPDLSAQVDSLLPEHKDALFGVMRQKFNEIQQMPEGPAKEARSAKYFKALEMLGPSIDPGAEEESSRITTPVAHVLDTLSGAGLSRAVLGEVVRGASKLASHFSDGTPLHAPDSTDLKRFMTNVGRGLNPVPGLTENVPSLTEYGASAGLDVKNPWTKYGLMAGDLASPFMASKAVSSIPTSASRAETAMSDAATSGDLAAAKAAHAQALAAADKNPWQKVGDFLKGYAGDRTNQYGQTIQNLRFSTADEANLAAGKVPFTQTWNKYGSPGFSANGVHSGMESVIEKLKSEIAKSTKDVSRIAPDNGASISEVLEPLDSQENYDKAMSLGATGPYNKAAESIRQSAKDLLENDKAYTGSQAQALKKAGTLQTEVNPATGRPAPVYTGEPQPENIEGSPRTTTVWDPKTESVTEGNPGVRVQNYVIDKATGRKIPTDLPEGQFDAKTGSWVKREVIPDERMGTTLQTTMTPTTTTTPGRTVKVNKADLSFHPDVPKDILDYENQVEPYPLSAEQLRNSASNMQAIAKANGAYSNDPSEAINRKAMADLSHQVGNNARELELKTVGTVAPKVAAENFQNYKDITSSLEGVKNLEEGAVNPPLRGSFNPVVNFANKTVKYTADPLAITLSKMLKTPEFSSPSTYPGLGLGAVRAYGIEQEGQDKVDPTSPWSALKLKKRMEQQ